MCEGNGFSRGKSPEELLSSFASTRRFGVRIGWRERGRERERERDRGRAADESCRERDSGIGCVRLEHMPKGEVKSSCGSEGDSDLVEWRGRKERD